MDLLQDLYRLGLPPWGRSLRGQRFGPSLTMGDRSQLGASLHHVASPGRSPGAMTHSDLGRFKRRLRRSGETYRCAV